MKAGSASGNVPPGPAFIRGSGLAVLGAFLACVVTCLVVCGCSSDSPSDVTSVPAAATDGFLIDRLERKVSLIPAAQRIVSLSPSTTELLFALGLGSSVVAVTDHCNFPEQAMKLPKVGGGTIESTSTEAILAAEPDLVLCLDDSHRPLIEALERLGVRCCALGAQNLEELYEQARWVGRLTGHEPEAASLIGAMEKRHGELSELVKTLRPEPPLRVFYEVWDDPLMTAAPNSFIGELLTMAGLQNIVTDTSIEYPRISPETVVAGDPDLILAPTSHVETIDVAEFAKRPGWERVPAVVHQRIRLISGDEVSRCGPRLLDALEEIIRAAYPDAVTSGQSAHSIGETAP